MKDLLSKIKRCIKNKCFWTTSLKFVKKRYLSPAITFFQSLFFRFFFKYFLLEVDPKKVVIVRGHGNGFGCNAKYIVLELLSRNLDCDVVWMLKKGDDPQAFPPGIRLVRYMSFAALKELVTAKVWLNNIVFPKHVVKWLCKKPGQVYIQTYHGAMGIKRIGQSRNDAKDVARAVPYVKKESEMLNYLIANSQWEADTLFKPYFHNKGEICLYGHPRNDIFFIKNKEEVIDAVKRKLNVPSAVKTVFYIPTWRSENELDCFALDYDRVKQAMEKRFGGEWCVFVRFHPYMKKSFCKTLLENVSSAIDVTSYDDIQELLLMADAVITDYSSCIYDYVLSRKPGFIFATDLERYNTKRGLYYPFEETPFQLACSNDKLVENILSFDMETYLTKVEKFLADKECAEDGSASKRVVDLIEKALKEQR